MHEEVKDLLTGALRSGKYPQTTGFLRCDVPGINESVEPPEPVEAGFCCMGVLCDISKIGAWKWDDTAGNYSYLGGCYDLPDEGEGLGGHENRLRRGLFRRQRESGVHERRRRNIRRDRRSNR